MQLPTNYDETSHEELDGAVGTSPLSKKDNAKQARLAARDRRVRAKRMKRMKRAQKRTATLKGGGTQDANRESGHQIFVTTDNDVTIVIRGAYRVLDVKLLMATKHRVLIECIRLLQWGKELQEEARVIPANSTLQMMLRLKGGAPPKGTEWVETADKSNAEPSAAWDDDHLSAGARKSATEWVNYLLSISRLQCDQSAVALLARQEDITEDQASRLIQETLWPGAHIPPRTRTELLQEVAKTFPEAMKEFLKRGSSTAMPEEEGEWAELDELLDRLCLHTIKTVAKIVNQARIHKLEFGEDGEPRRTDETTTFLPGKCVTETLVISNLSIASRQPLIRFLQHLNLSPGLKGGWPTDCEFVPGNKRLSRQIQMKGTGSASFTFQRTPEGIARVRGIYLGTTPIEIQGQTHQPTVRLDRGNRGEITPRLAFVPSSDASRQSYAFVFALVGLYCSESETLAALVYLSQKTHAITTMAELFTDEIGKCAANIMTKDGQNARGGQLVVGLASKRIPMHEAQQEVLDAHEGRVLDFNLFAAYPNEHDVPEDLRGYRGAHTLSLRLTRTGRTTEREMKSMVAVSMRLHHEASRNAMTKVLREGQGSTSSAVEAVVEARCRDLLTYCLGNDLNVDDLAVLLNSVEGEVTTQRKNITDRSLIILMLNHQNRFPAEQVRFWALQIGMMIAIRSNKPELRLMHFCPVTNFDPTDTSVGETNTSKECTLEGISYVGFTQRHRLFYDLTDTRQAGPTAGTISDADITQDLIVANIINSILGGQGSHALTNGTILKLAEIRKSSRVSADRNVVDILRSLTRSSFTPKNLCHGAAALQYTTYGEAPAPRDQPPTELEKAQREIRDTLGMFLHMSVEIGRTLAAIADTSSSDPLQSPARLELATRAVTTQLHRWVATATVGPMSHQSMVRAIFVDVEGETMTREVPSNLSHRILIGVMSFFIRVSPQSDGTLASKILFAILLGLLKEKGTSRGTACVAASVMVHMLDQGAGLPADDVNYANLKACATKHQIPPQCTSCGRYHDETHCPYCSTFLGTACFRKGSLILAGAGRRAEYTEI